MEITDGDALLRRVKRTVPDHWGDGHPRLQAFGLRKLDSLRTNPETGKPIVGKAGKYERGYSVNVARLTTIKDTTGGDPNYVVVGFRVAELRAKGFEIEADMVTEGHPSYAGPLTANPAHALAIASVQYPLYSIAGKERLASCCYHVDQETGELGARVILDLQ